MYEEEECSKFLKLYEREKYQQISTRVEKGKEKEENKRSHSRIIYMRAFSRILYENLTVTNENLTELDLIATIFSND